MVTNEREPETKQTSHETKRIQFSPSNPIEIGLKDQQQLAVSKINDTYRKARDMHTRTERCAAICFSVFLIFYEVYLLMI